MHNLQKDILNILHENKSNESILNKLSKYQSILLKNHSNPVLDNEDKVKILNIYNKLQELGNSLYRYDMLKKNNLSEDAQAEKENLENVVLKGGISNVRYIWHSEQGENTCEECLDLDGLEFDTFDEIPERPHPNCQCVVDIVEDIPSNTNTGGGGGVNTEKKKKSKMRDIILGILQLLAKGLQQQNTVDLLTLSYYNTQSSESFPIENIEFKNNVEGLNNPALIRFVRNKLIKQIGRDNSKGIVFKEKSKLSQRIKNSKDFKNHIKKYKSNLLENGNVDTSSIEFGFNDVDLYNSLHYADVYKMYIDESNNLHVIIIDTYDFNKGELNPAVNVGRFLQKKDILKNLYVIINVEMSYGEWAEL